MTNGEKHDIFWNSQAEFGSVPLDALDIGGIALSETE
jgi:hypothetical protein